MPIAVIVDWYGPYLSYDDFVRVGKAEKRGRWLYMGVRRQAGRRSIQYVGLSTNLAGRFVSHHKLGAARLNEYYLGEICTAGLSGRRKSTRPADLNLAERALIAWFQPKLNETSRTNPDDCVVVFSRFFDISHPYEPTQTPDWFDGVIAYNSWSQEWERSIK